MELGSHVLLGEELFRLDKDFDIFVDRDSFLRGLGGADGWWGVCTPFHFYDPVVGGGLFGFLPSARWVGCWYFRRAVRAYVRGDFVRSYVLLGRCCHVLMDVGVPAHSNNLPHLLRGDCFEAFLDGEERFLRDRGGVVKPENSGFVEDLFYGLASDSYRFNVYPNSLCLGKKMVVELSDVYDQINFLLPRILGSCLVLLEMFKKEVGLKDE